jgi:hypothetical protein
MATPGVSNPMGWLTLRAKEFHMTEFVAGNVKTGRVYRRGERDVCVEWVKAHLGSGAVILTTQAWNARNTRKAVVAQPKEKFNQAELQAAITKLSGIERYANSAVLKAALKDEPLSSKAIGWLIREAKNPTFGLTRKQIGYGAFENGTLVEFFKTHAQMMAWIEGQNNAVKACLSYHAVYESAS